MTNVGISHSSIPKTDFRFAALSFPRNPQLLYEDVIELLPAFRQTLNSVFEENVDE